MALPRKSPKTKPKAAPRSNDDGYALVTDKVIAALEAGVVPWRKPWKGDSGLPRSLSSNKPYRGVNVLLLGLASALDGHTSPWWGTYKQIAEDGGQVRRGEKGTAVTLWKTFPKREQQDDGTWKVKTIPLLRTFVVFNVGQADWADGLPKRCQPKAVVEHDPIEAAEAILATYLASDNAPGFAHNGGDRAFYVPSADRIALPERSAFDTAEAYYSTAYHECGHSTGHKSRLARPGVIEGHRFGDEAYSKEELVAELTAAFLCGVAGIEQAEQAQSAGYIGHWLEVLRGDHKLVIQAAGQAQKAADLVQGISVSYEAAEPATPDTEPQEAIAA